MSCRINVRLRLTQLLCNNSLLAYVAATALFTITEAEFNLTRAFSWFLFFDHILIVMKAKESFIFFSLLGLIDSLNSLLYGNLPIRNVCVLIDFLFFGVFFILLGCCIVLRQSKPLEYWLSDS